MKTSHYYSVDGADACIRPTMHWVYKTVESVTSPEFKVITPSSNFPSSKKEVNVSVDVKRDSNCFCKREYAASTLDNVGAACNPINELNRFIHRLKWPLKAPWLRFSESYDIVLPVSVCVCVL